MKRERVLVVSPHPDDEALGVGGTILKLREMDFEVHWLVFTNMDEKNYNKEAVRIRNMEIDQVYNGFNMQTYLNFNLIPAELDLVPLKQLVTRTKKYLSKIKPTVVFIPHFNDAHSDHGVVHDTMISNLKLFRYPELKYLFAYETISETDATLKQGEIFRPNIYVDISKYLSKKLKICSIYKSEFSDFPFPRSLEAVEALAKYRGAQSGHHAAEAFQLIIGKPFEQF